MLKAHIQNNFKSLFSADKHHLLSLDGLRAIAIMLVVFLHLVFYVQYYPTTTQAFFTLPIFVKWLAKGTLGVDIFFVLSGFLIGTILLEEIKKNSKLIEGNFLFSLAIAYIILATTVSTNKTAPILTKFLSLRFFTPIAKISYSAYLFHVPVIFITYSLFFNSSKTAFELIMIGDAVSILMTVIVSALSYILVEQTFRVKRKPSK